MSSEEELPLVPERQTSFVDCCISLWDFLSCATICCSYQYALTIQLQYGDGTPVAAATVTVTDVDNDDYSAQANLVDGSIRIAPLAFRGPYSIAFAEYQNPRWLRTNPVSANSPPQAVDRQARTNATTTCQLVCYDVELINELGEPITNRDVTAAIKDNGNRNLRTDNAGRLRRLALGDHLTSITIADIHEHADGDANALNSGTHFAHI